MSACAMETVVCPGCGGRDAAPFAEGRDFENPQRGEVYRLEKCRGCGFVYENPRPAPQELPKFYAAGKYYSYIELDKKESRQIGRLEKLRHFLFEKTVGFHYGGRRGVFDRFCAWIGKGRFGSAPKGLKPGRILDIGCGDGVFLDAVRRFGWEPHGVEISAEAAARADKRGLRVHAGDLASAGYPDRFFDVVRMWSVLEHVAHPMEVLREINRVLKPGGVLILQVPNIASFAFRVFGSHWTGLDLPRHFTHFSPLTLLRGLKKSGFDVLKLQFSSVGTSLSSLQFHRGKPLPGWAFAAGRVATVFFDRVCDLLGRGDCMVAHAVKR